MNPRIVSTRNLDPTAWTEATIRSVIERGDLPDWQAMFAAGAADNSVAEIIVSVSRLPEGIPMSELSPPEVLAAELATLRFPDLAARISCPCRD